LPLRIPYGEAGHDGGVGAQGYAGQAAGRAGGNAEEIHEDALRRCHIRIHENANGFAGSHCSKQPADEIVFIDRAIAVHRAVALEKPVNVGIVERPHDDR